MGPRLPEPEDDDLIDLPSGSLADDEGAGVEDAEELLFQELDLSSEEVGLDAETLGNADPFGSLLLDEDEGEGDDLLDDTTLQVDADINADEAEHGWLEESDGAEGEWADELPDELEEEIGDDGGEEGVDDPLLDGLPEDPQRTRKLDEEDDAEGLEDDGLDEFARELPTDA